MDEQPTSYYPSDLPLQLADLLTSAHTIDVRRVGKGGSTIHREHLTCDGKVVQHDGRSDLSDEQLAAICYNAAEAHADAHHKGSGRYRLTLTYAKPPRGFPTKARSIEFQVGDAEETTDANVRSDLLAQMVNLWKLMGQEHIHLIRETTKLASVVSTMVGSLATANAALTERERAIARESEEGKMVREQSERSERRERMVMKMVMPLVQGLMAGKAAFGIAGAPATSSYSALVSNARALGSSMTPEQLAAAGRIFGAGATERLAELRDSTIDADVLAFGLWLFEQPIEVTLSFYEQLSDEQRVAAERLQSMIVAASQSNAVDDDAGGDA